MTADQTTENLESLRRHLERVVEEEKGMGASPAVNKRRHERHLYMVEAKIAYFKRFDQLGACPAEFTVYTKDISRSGLSFLNEHEMYPGEIVRVEVNLGGARRELYVKLVRCRRAGLKVFDVGGVFISQQEAEQAEQGEAPDAPDADDDC